MSSFKYSLIFLFLLIIGCGSPQKLILTYEGEELPIEKAAVLRMTTDTHSFSINGKVLKPNNRKPYTFFSLLPGHYKIIWRPSIPSVTYCHLYSKTIMTRWKWCDNCYCVMDINIKRQHYYSVDVLRTDHCSSLKSNTTLEYNTTLIQREIKIKGDKLEHGDPTELNSCTIVLK
jgi:hypothetical protein